MPRGGVPRLQQAQRAMESFLSQSLQAEEGLAQQGWSLSQDCSLQPGWQQLEAAVVTERGDQFYIMENGI